MRGYKLYLPHIEGERRHCICYPISWKCKGPTHGLFIVSFECSYPLYITLAKLLTVGVVFKYKLVIALLLVHAAADVDDPLLAGLVGHDAARGVVVRDHEVFYGMVWVVAERADPDAVVVLSPAGAK